MILDYYGHHAGEVQNRQGVKFNVLESLPLLYKYKHNKFEAIRTPNKILSYRKKILMTGYEFESEDILWLSTNHGLFRWNINTGESFQYFKDVFFTDLMIDSEGNYWATTKGQGLYFMPDLRIQSKKMQASKVGTTKLALLEDQLLVGLENEDVEIYNTGINLAFERKISANTKSEVSALTTIPKTKEYWICNGMGSRYFKEKTELGSNNPKRSYGTVNGATLTTDRFGNADHAYYFDGVDDFIDLGDDAAFQMGSNDFAISLWIKTDSVVPKGCILGKVDPAAVNNYTQYSIWYNNTGGLIYSSCRDDNNNSA